MTASEKLRNHLLDPRVGALLSSDRARRRRNSDKDSRKTTPQDVEIDGLPSVDPRRVFKLPSGRCTEYFVSFWEIFDDEDVYADFLDAFEEAAFRLHEDPRTIYDAIATSTPTGRYILDDLLSRLHDRGLQVDHYLLDQLPLTDHDARLPDLSSIRVLILTDVISTGSLIRKLAGTVQRLGGRPVAALGGVHTQNELPSIQIPAERGTAEPIPVEFLTRLVIADASADTLDDAALWPIDPFKVFPEEQGEPLREPLRTSFQLVQDTEAAGAIRFGFFKADWHRVLTAINVPRFLEHKADLVAAAFEEELRAADLLVTTHSRAELLLRRSLAEKLGVEAAKWLLLPCKASPEGRETHFLLPKHEDLIDRSGEAAKAVIVFFSVHTAERLRDIVSLLATHGVHQVSVLTVIDRMPNATAGFTSRLANLVRGTRGNAGGQPGRSFTRSDAEPLTSFDFRSVYYLHEFDTSTLIELEDVTRQILRIYTRSTRSPSFSYELAHDFKYLSPVSVASPRFLASRPEYPGEPALVAILDREFQPAPSPGSLDGQLTLLLESVLSSRNYSLVADVMVAIVSQDGRRSREKERLFTLFGVLLADIQYIKRTHHFTYLRDQLFGAITALREKRMARERQAGCNPSSLAFIAEQVERETDLVVLLGLLAFFDSGFDYQAAVESYLAQGLDSRSSAFEATPGNLFYFYYNARVAFACSLSIILGYPGLRKPRTQEMSALQRSIDDIRQFIRQTEIPESVCAAIALCTGATPAETSTDLTPTGLRRAILDNLTLLENDLSPDRPRERHSILRYLFQHVLDPKRDHNPVWRNLDNGIQVIDLLLRSAGTAEVDSTYDKNSLEAAYRAAGLAEQISGAARRFFYFHTAAEDASVYTKTRDEDGLLALLKRVSEGLHEVRKTGSVTRRLAQRIIGDWARAKHLLFPDGGHQPLLAQELRGHLIRLAPLITESLEKAGRSFRDDRSIPWEEWSRTLQEGGVNALLSERPAAGDYEIHDEERRPAIVLCAPPLASEMFRNYFSNLRHLREAAINAGLEMGLGLSVRRDWRELEDETKEYWVVRLDWQQGIPISQPPEGSTWKKHERQIERYGGALVFSASESYCEIWCLARTASGGPPTSWIGRS